MSLQAFFTAARPWLAGQTSPGALRSLGSTPSSDADLAFYPWLIAHDQQRILVELLPFVKTWIDATHGDWTGLVAAYVAAHPPTGVSVPTVAVAFADWLADARRTDPQIPVGIEALADLGWTRFLARTAPDGDGLGLDRRVFVRQYSVDPIAIENALRAGCPVPETTAVTLVVHRDESTGKAALFPATLASIAVLVAASGAPLEGALALPTAVLRAERARLTERGVLPPGDTP